MPQLITKVPVTTKSVMSGADILKQSAKELRLDMKDLERVGFGTSIDTITISVSPISEALMACQGILSQMDTINSSDEVKEIDQSFSNGDFPEKVLSFVKKKEDSTLKLKPRMFGEPTIWEINACMKEDCPQRQQCTLSFTRMKYVFGVYSTVD